MGVAKYGGVAVLLQTLERHIERADVLIAASETLVLISLGSTSMQNQMMPARPVVQGIIANYESARDRNTKKGGAKLRDCEVVLRSLRKLEAQLGAQPVLGDDESDAGTPRTDEKADEYQVKQSNVSISMDLQQRLGKWKPTR